MSLRDILSDDVIESLIDFSVNDGDVIRMHLDESDGVKSKNAGDNGRNKYFIVLGHDNYGNAIGCVLINTEINKSIPQERKDLHYKLQSSKYLFLQGKSRYVDCSVFKIISKDKFNKHFSYDSKKGKIDDDDMELIRGAVMSSKFIPRAIIKRFGLDNK